MDALDAITLIGVAFAVLFGVWGRLEASDALKQTREANRIATAANERADRAIEIAQTANLYSREANGPVDYYVRVSATNAGAPGVNVEWLSALNTAAKYELMLATRSVEVDQGVIPLPHFLKSGESLHMHISIDRLLSESKQFSNDSAFCFRVYDSTKGTINLIRGPSRTCSTS